MATIMSRGRFSVITVALVLVLAWSIRSSTQSERQPDIKTDPGRTFVGAQACASCHKQAHEAWTSGRHSKMLQPATAATVKADFVKGGITLNGSPYRLRVANGAYFITESYLTGKEREHRVEYTLGSRRIQHYLTTIENGWIIVLPPSWDVQRQEWFDNMEIVRPDENDQKLVQQWNRNCVGCHVSQQENNYSPATRTYATQWVDFGTSCERCHGPGSEHVQAYTRPERGRAAGERSIIRPTRLDPRTSSMICAQCHSLRDVIAPGYTAGEDYFDYFQPVLEYGPRKAQDPAYWPDGRPRRFSNDALGLWQSECFLRGDATCASCHKDSHVPDIDRNAQLASTSNALCTGCHQNLVGQLTTHTRHRADSAGSSCVECHMPKTVMSIKSTMRDHTMSLPAPENTVAFGIPNACTECHADRKAPWAVETLEKWRPQGRRLKHVARAEAFTAARAGRPEALDRLIAIAADDRQGPLIQANAAGYLGTYKGPRAAAALLGAAKADHPAIRSVAISSLGAHVAGEGDLRQAQGVPSQSSEAPRRAIVAALDDPHRAVRISALVSLINGGGGPLAPVDEARFRRVGAEFAARASLHQDDAGIQRDLGLTRLLTGDLDLAADALQISVGLDPDRASARFFLAMARLGQRRVDDARVLLKQVPASDPFYRQAQERLKQIEPPR
jgi:predicted CXXCH cytochrome family protein